MQLTLICIQFELRPSNSSIGLCSFFVSIRTNCTPNQGLWLSLSLSLFVPLLLLLLAELRNRFAKNFNHLTRPCCRYFVLLDSTNKSPLKLAIARTHFHSTSKVKASRYSRPRNITNNFHNFNRNLRQNRPQKTGAVIGLELSASSV